jgi:hypothetical protein
MSGESAERAAGPVHIDQALAVLVDHLASIAWQKLGLQPDPITGTTQKDLAQARRAIDATDALAKVLLPSLDDDDRRQVSNLLNDLKANFVTQGGGAQ